MRHKAGFYEKYIKRLLDIVLDVMAERAGGHTKLLINAMKTIWLVHYRKRTTAANSLMR